MAARQVDFQLNFDDIPDVRDGLTRVQRVVLFKLREALRETGREFVPSVMLYGRVVEHVNLSEYEFQNVLQSLGVADSVR